jgi:glucose/arabinose dehydrogenase
MPGLATPMPTRFRLKIREFTVRPRFIVAALATVLLAWAGWTVQPFVVARLGVAATPLPRLKVTLTKVAKGFRQTTDIQFVPGLDRVLVGLRKTGTAGWVSLADRSHGDLLKVEVLTASEEGLLGLAFHPKFVSNRRFFLNYVAQKGEPGTRQTEVTRIAEWTLPADFRAGGKAREVRTILEVEQPYPNHNAGQLAFGPDGKLYIGFGDGGSGGDPGNRAQDKGQLLGKMLRVDVDRADPGLHYAVPPDNPFVGQAGVRPEIWALGLRNPWRYSFDGKGRLWVGDVGQDKWEEVDLIEKAGNYGWNVREARHCFKPKEGCKTQGFIDPVYEYGHGGDGLSITGGYVYEGKAIPTLRGKYVFSDYGSARLYGLDPDTRQALDLGRFDLIPTTFGRDARGELYVGDFGTGDIYRLDPPP